MTIDDTNNPYNKIVVPIATLVKLHSSITNLSLSESLKWIRNNEDYYYNILNTFKQEYSCLTIEEILNVLKLSRGNTVYADNICNIIKHARQDNPLKDTSNTVNSSMLNNSEFLSII